MTPVWQPESCMTNYAQPWAPGHCSADALHMQGDEAFAAKLFTYATSQINYMLGDGGQSYVIGFGKDSPTTPFHKWCVAQSFPSAT